MASIHLYAELLLNIRQVTVLATLPSKSHEGTHVHLGPHQKTLHLRHGDIEAIIELPCMVIDTKALTLPAAASQELSFRFGVSPDAFIPTQRKLDLDSHAPWPASKLSCETQVGCQSCGHLLVKNVNVWKDLPSGGWADMMDFWHCHKPGSEEETDEVVGSTKGYAAANVLRPTAAVGLVDITRFMIADINCTGTQVRMALISLAFLQSFLLELHGQQEGGLLPTLSFHRMVTDTIALDNFRPDQSSQYSTYPSSDSVVAWIREYLDDLMSRLESPENFIA